MFQHKRGPQTVSEFGRLSACCCVQARAQGQPPLGGYGIGRKPDEGTGRDGSTWDGRKRPAFEGLEKGAKSHYQRLVTQSNPMVCCRIGRVQAVVFAGTTHAAGTTSVIGSWRAVGTSPVGVEERER